MSTQYPANIDTTGTLPYVVDGVSPIVAADVNKLRDAIVAVETELGANPSGTETTVAARMGAIETTFSGLAPNSASYLVVSANVSLTNERLLTIGSGLVAIDGGAGNGYTIELATTGAVAGEYTQPAFTVDGYGRISFIEDGTFSSSAGSYLLSNITVDGYGRLVTISSGADGYAGKLAYWQSDTSLAYDGYVDVSGAGVLSFSDDLFFGRYAAGETILGGFLTPVNYVVMESNSSMLISSNSNDGLLIGSNIRGVVGSNSDPWVGQTFDGNRTVITNKTAGSSISIFSPSASMLDASTPFSLGIAGFVALASGLANDGYGTAIESEEDLAISALGGTAMLLANNAAGAATVRIGAIAGNGPAASANWFARYGDAAGHVLSTADFIYDGYAQIRVGTSGGAPNPQYSFANDIGTGIYRLSSGSIGFASNGTHALSVSINGLRSVDGVVGAPAYSFTDDTTAGMYSDGPNSIGFATGGIRPISITSTGIKGVDGTSTDPLYSFISDTDTGIFLLSAGVLGLTAGGIGLLYCGGGVVQGYGTSTFQLNPGSPNAAAPAYSFALEADTGMYLSAANQVGLSTGGTKRAHIDSVELASSVPFHGAAGSSSAPTFAFTSDTNTGFYQYEPGSIGMSLDGSVSRTKSATLTTTNDTATTIMSIATDSNKAYHIEYRIVGRNTTGSNNNAVFTGTIRAVNKAGTLTVAKVEYASSIDSSPTWGGTTITTSTTNVLIQVAGQESPSGDTDWLIFVNILSV